MSIDIDVPFLELEKIESEAEKFLARYHPSKVPPVPIEDIIEFDLALGIDTYQNLERHIGMVSALTQDMKSISIDESVFSSNSNLNRCRYSLAHEVGHIVLHGDIYRSFPCKSVYDWKEFLLNINPKKHDRLEFQAYQFAGLVLVPKDQLEVSFREIQADLMANGHDPHESYEMFEDYLIKRLMRIFKVSRKVLEKRTNYEGLVISS